MGSAPFRFDVQLRATGDRTDVAQRARHPGDLGYHSLALPDRPAEALSAGPTLVALAEACTLRVATHVLCNDLRRPVLVATDAATLDVLSDGRFDLGISASRPDDDCVALGRPLPPAADWIECLDEAIHLVASRSLATRSPSPDATTPSRGSACRTAPSRSLGRRSRSTAAAGACPSSRGGWPTSSSTPRLGAGGIDRRAAELDGTRAATEQKLLWVREAAAQRRDAPEISFLMSVCKVTTMRVDLVERLAGSVGVDPAALASSPALLDGSIEELVEHVTEGREVLGVSRFVVPEQAARSFAPVVERTAGAGAHLRDSRRDRGGRAALVADGGAVDRAPRRRMA